MISPLRTAPEVDYPESDGKPMAESDIHLEWMITIITRLKRRYARQRVYVSGNLLIYYVEGKPGFSVAPDAFVVKDCDPRRRRIFKIWEEGLVPNFILETTSKTTKREDQRDKKELYAKLGVGEYVLYDPLGEWLKQRLLGYRLTAAGEDYDAIEPDQDGNLLSEQLGLAFRLEDGALVMRDARTGRPLMSDQEAEEAANQKLANVKKRARQAEQRAEREAAARKKLEEELARLKAQRGSKGP